jgi:hypothetical protein
MAALGVAPVLPTSPWPLGNAALLNLDMSEAAEHFEAEREALPAQRTRRRAIEGAA